ncbi:hypothetical protein SLEP1_g34407 [Rubroshorea leprosula]|uniref:Integrase zinc-binding domain-containing protein n=1 Tax=Rubroshorea leprosula TaxID=152421 RepID=A0AAV5KJR5_9ROSI|nr:hypothetical protein SLEP1_g34407 [Rubroshorea leprosula]
MEWMKDSGKSSKMGLHISDDGIIRLGDRICVPYDEGLRIELLQEAHKSNYTIHLGSTKMYHDLKETFWWKSMKKLTKSAHFMAIKQKYPLDKLAKLYVQEIVRLHEVLVSIVSDRDPRTIQVLEDMLRACALDLPESWDDHLPLVEFAYNNSYHSSIKMAPYKALYGRRYKTPICWAEVGYGRVMGPDFVQKTTEKVKLIQQKLKVAQDRQKSYADNRRRPLKFEVGDHVFLKVSPTKGVYQFGLKGKLSPRYIGLFEILERVGEVVYRIALPSELSNVHNVFHVSVLRTYEPNPSHVINYEPLELKEDLSYTKQLV